MDPLATTPRPPGDRVKILIADDREDGLLALEAVLLSPEYDLVKARSGMEALAALFDEDFAVIIMDVQMPGLNGFETARMVRQHVRSKDTPIIFVTAINKDDHYVHQGYEIGAVDYIFKPFNPTVLKSKVGVFVNLFRHARTIQRQSEQIAAVNGELKREIAERVKTEETLARSQDQLRALSNKLMTAQEEERRHISRDLHDDLGQTLTCVNLDLQRALKLEPGKDRDILEIALRTVQKAQRTVRELSTMLRPPLLDDLGLKEAIHCLVSDFHKRTAIETDLVLQFENADIPDVAGTNIYRIVQEALNNVAKYAQARAVAVHILASSGAVLLRVKDDGVGCDLASRGNKTLGLLGMKERAELLGGQFRISTALGQGTDIQVKLPGKSVEPAKPRENAAKAAPAKGNAGVHGNGNGNGNGNGHKPPSKEIACNN